MKEKKIDKFFLTTTLLLMCLGVAMFISASLGILVKNEKTFYSVLFNQLILGFGLGFLGMFFCLKVNYKFWRKSAFYIFIGTIFLTAAVFIPHVGWSHGGATRWIKLGPLGTFQPVEFLKFGFVLYFAAWLSWAKGRVSDFKFGFLPFGIMVGIIALVLLRQPDTKSLILIIITGISMFFISGGPVKYILSLILGSLAIFALLVAFTPYLQERVKTFINPSQDIKGSSYQIQQSYIALGSGGILGRGFGQSIQKFSYLPEPQGDSVFAVLGEEVGFVGAIFTILLYAVFALRGLQIANNSSDLFSRLLVSGIVIMISAQSFMNIASIVGVFPLTGVPLVFMSQGGTSLMVDLIAVGIVFQISKFQIKRK
jgi:cell division protein FtsW